MTEPPDATPGKDTIWVPPSARKPEPAPVSDGLPAVLDNDTARTHHSREPATATTEEELLLQFEQLIAGLATSMGEHAVRPALEGAIQAWREHAQALQVSLQSDVTRLLTHLQRVESRFEETRRATERRLAGLDSRLQTIEGRLDRISAALEDVHLWVKHRRDFARLQERRGGGA